MSTFSKTKKQRQINLIEEINKNPFLTDEDIALKFSVSIPTVRLDRLELGIPELRKRIKDVASENLSKIKAMATEDIIGEIIDIVEQNI